jgi:allantoin racemase
MLGYKFSIISILERFKAPMEELVKKYGIEDRCASIRCTDVPVIELRKIRLKVKKHYIKQERRLLKSTVLKCYVLVVLEWLDLMKSFEKKLGVPVIDPVAAAVKFLEGIIGYGKKTSKIMTFNYPEKKRDNWFSRNVKF